MAHRLVIRIVYGEREATDWEVQSEIAFRDVLDVISRVSPQATATAFEYEDEDGDRITVRSDDELKAMLSFFSWVKSQHVSQGLQPPPIIIYPRGCRTPSKRNIYGLTVNTKAAPSTSSVTQTSSNNIRKNPGDLETILKNGQVCNSDLRYLEVLGYGNGGTVYRSLHVPSNRVMAVKVIPLDVTPEVQKQIMSELDILFKCESPCIIEFYGAFFVENRISMCTEFMDGGSLDVYRCIPEPVLGRITVAVVKGLVYLWELKIMHRDVKPSNILVNTLGQVKLCDFGVSTQLVSSIATTYVGTNAYMAPERILGDEYGVYSEVWSLGISLLELALGKFPYPPDGPSKSDALLPIELLQCIVHENPPSLPPDRFTPPFLDFIAKCLQKVPKSRPTPESLLEHDFIKANDDHNTEMISMWVCHHLEQLKTHQQLKTDHTQMNGDSGS